MLTISASIPCLFLGVAAVTIAGKAFAQQGRLFPADAPFQGGPAIVPPQDLLIEPMGTNFPTTDADGAVDSDENILAPPPNLVPSHLRPRPRSDIKFPPSKIFEIYFYRNLLKPSASPLLRRIAGAVSPVRKTLRTPTASPETILASSRPLFDLSGEAAETSDVISRTRPRFGLRSSAASIRYFHEPIGTAPPAPRTQPGKAAPPQPTSGPGGTAAKTWAARAAMAALILAGLGVSWAYAGAASASSLAALSLLGLTLGMRHAADPDHVVAVSTIVARNRKFGTSWLLGAFWGLGHTATIFIVGSAIILFHMAIPPRVGLSMEFAVGAVLVVLGALNMAGRGLGALGPGAHSHAHAHDDPEHRHEFPDSSQPHVHAHLHAPELGWLRRHMRNAGAFQILRSTIVGLVHGLAGSAAVALLVLAAIHTPQAAVLYLLIFGLGTLLGMLGLSALMELTMLHAVRWWGTAQRALTFGTGLLSLVFGLYILYHIGFTEGLFTASPHWIPQ